MTARRPSKRAFYKIYSKRDEVVDATPESRREFEENPKLCPNCHCPTPGWDSNPEPIRLDVVPEPRGCVALVGMVTKIVRNDLFELLKPYLVGVIPGTVSIAEADQPRRASPYLTAFVPRHMELEAYRGRYCRHVQCQGCRRRFWNRVGWASGAIIERYLDDRLVYLDDMQDLYIDAELAASLDLKLHFPDIKLYKFDVIPEPLDGDVLPGDPGWDGTFHPRPLPELPPELPRRGRWTVGGELDGPGECIVSLYLPGEPSESSLLDLDVLESSLRGAVLSATAGEWHDHGFDNRRRAWRVRFRGPEVRGLTKTISVGLHAYLPLLPIGWYMTGRLKGGREMRIES